MLTLETGEGLADADSIVTLDEVRAFASSRGKSVSAVDATLEAQVRVAHDYLVAIETRLYGWRRTEGQALPFPRNNLILFGHSVPEGIIPSEAKRAICQLVIEGLERDALPSQDGRVVITETVGPLSTTYANGGTVTANPAMPRVDAFLGPLLKTSNGLSSERV